MTRSRLAWAALVVVVIVAIGLAAFAGGPSHVSAAKRADTIARGIRCPTCTGQSVAESGAPAAQAIRTEIRRRVDLGETKQEIDNYVEDRYGSDILLTPPSRGFDSLIWIAPVVALVGAAAGLWLALQRWSRRSLAQPSAADRALVATAEVHE